MGLRGVETREKKGLQKLKGEPETVRAGTVKKERGESH